MPFDQERTTHGFRATATGGVQRVVANARKDAHQVMLIREHLRRETGRFAAGDFADPMAIHGMKMPGITALRQGYWRVKVTYSKMAGGAKISYTTADASLVAALHEWFDAQLADHGAHAHG